MPGRPRVWDNSGVGHSGNAGFMDLSFLFILVAGYLLGSIPAGYLVGRAHGIDIREHGSGNIGATNVLRVLGKKPGIFVFVCDALKGGLAVFIGRSLIFRDFFAKPIAALGREQTMSMFGRYPLAEEWIWHMISIGGVVAALACILGHNFPVWLKFRGGKGIATTAGVLLGLMPLAVAVAGAIWAAVFFTLRYVSVASLSAAAALPIAVGFLWRAGRADGSIFVFSLVAAALAFWRHRSNIQRLISGTEPRFTKKKSHAETQSRREEEREEQKAENS